MKQSTDLANIIDCVTFTQDPLDSKSAIHVPKIKKIVPCLGSYFATCFIPPCQQSALPQDTRLNRQRSANISLFPFTSRKSNKNICIK